MQLLVESLAVAQATPVPTVDMLDDKALAGDPARSGVHLSLLASISRQKCGSHAVRMVYSVAGEGVGDHRSPTNDKCYKKDVCLVVSS